MSDKTNSQESSRETSTISLHNRFVELMLIVGLDENTGLTPGQRDNDSDDGGDSLTSIFDQSYDAQVLAAISSSKALIFQPYLVEDPNYPPTETSLSNPESFQRLRSTSLEKEKYSVNRIRRKHRQAYSQRSVTVSAAVIKKRLNNSESSNPSKMAADLPLSKDAIEAITTFCYPDSARVFQEKQESSIHFLVLTDVSGKKTYTACLTFYRQYLIEKHANGQISYRLYDPNYQPSSSEAIQSIQCFMPQCCVLVSKYPYYYAMKECLSCLISHVERDQEEMFQFIKDFTYSMTMAPVPPAGNVIVELSVYNFFVTLFPSEWPEKPVLDIPLHLAFLCFPTDDLLKIFTAILCEERLVFVSFNYALLTIIMESFLYYILPFSWRFTYVPILSASSLELLEAPGTFMMGCHSKHLNVVQQVEGLVIVNIDEGTVSLAPPPSPTPSRVRKHTAECWNFYVCNNPLSNIPDMPTEPASLFKKICHRAKFQMELSDVQRPFNFDITAERTYRIKKCLQFNTEISFACLEMMVNLFRCVLPYLRIELRRFSKQQFLDSLAEEDKPFYEMVVETDMFKTFLEDRLNEKIDYWSDHEMKTRPYAKRFSVGNDAMMGGLSHRQQMKPQRRQVSFTTFSSLAPRTFEVLRLPALTDPLSYTRSAIAKLNTLIENCRSPTHRSSYVYLRGMFHAAEGNTHPALDDLLSLYSHNSRLLPMTLIQKLLHAIPESEREDLLQRKGISDLMELCQEDEKRHRSGVIEKISVPDTDLCLEDFVETVSLLEMATDYDTIQRLFLALAQPSRPTHVEKYTFEVVRFSYEDNQSQCEDLDLPDGCLQTNEIILRVSSLIKTDFGMGRIVLTDKRIFFIKDVSKAYREVIKLRDISKLEKVMVHTFLNIVDALVVWDNHGKACFTATLKGERNLWCMLIEEMRAGKMVAEATKDYTAITHAIQNVLLVDAVVRSGQDEHTTHHSHAIQAADTLRFFYAYMTEGRHKLPADTLRALQHRVDPNQRQRERKTVEVMLYTPGSHMEYSGSSSVSPRLWCGMGDGKVRVFDATNWTLEDNFVQTRSTVAALVAVGEGQVWAGSHGIFIIDTDTITCNKTLMDHPDVVADIILTGDGRHAFSASVEGTIIKWEVQTLRQVSRIFMANTRSLKSIQFYDDKLWCGTWEHIVALDMEGHQLQTFTLTSPAVPGVKPIDIDCFEVFNDEIWAGCRREGQLIVWDEKTTQLKHCIKLDCRGISVILLCGSFVWVGTKDGTIYVYLAETKEMWKKIKAHDDAIRSLCAAEDRYIMSGAGSKDGKVAIWNPNIDPVDSETF